MLEQIGVRQTGSGMVKGAFDRGRLIDDLAKSLFYSQDKDTQRYKLNSIAGAVADALARGEVQLSPVDAATHDRYPKLRFMVDDRAIAELVERELSTDAFRVQRVLYALSIRGRNDRPNRAGWRAASDALSWILTEFPELGLSIPDAHFNPGTEGWLVRESVPWPRTVLKRNGRSPSTFSYDQFLRSVTKALYGRTQTYERAIGVANHVLSQLAGQPTVHSMQLAVGALNSLRRVDDIAYLRAAASVKGFERVTSIAEEAVALIEAPSRRLFFEFPSSKKE